MTTKAKTAVDPNAFSALGDAFESAADRFEEGTANARKSAKQAAGTAQRVARIGVYNAAYGISYGFVYATVFLTELLPKENILRRGLEEGADAAFEAQTKHQAAKPEPETVAAKPAAKKKTKAGGRKSDAK